MNGRALPRRCSTARARRCRPGAAPWTRPRLINSGPTCARTPTIDGSKCSRHSPEPMTPAPHFAAHGAQIPALGFGTSPMTGGLAPDTVVAALHAGYRHIDTAWKYGTERAVGEAMRASGIPRGDIFLTTKVSHEYLRADALAKSV